jgi:hypothetical protein
METPIAMVMLKGLCLSQVAQLGELGLYCDITHISGMKLNFGIKSIVGKESSYASSLGYRIVASKCSYGEEIDPVILWKLTYAH